MSMTTSCPICDGRLVEKDSYGIVQECELCGEVFETIPTSRKDKLIGEYFANISRRLWGR